MAKIEWEDKFSVQNEGIDNQHKKWISIYNQAHDRMMNAKPGENLHDIGRNAIKEMIEYGKYHFACEEKHMAAIGFSELDAHKTIHKEFAAKLGTIASQMEAGEMVLNSEIIKLIHNWLVEHILKEDQKYKQ